MVEVAGLHKSVFQSVSPQQLYLHNTLDEVAVSAAKKTYIPVVEGIPTSLFLDSGFQCGGNFFPLNLEGREEMAPSLTL